MVMPVVPSHTAGVATNKTRAEVITGLVFLGAGLAGLYVFGYMPWRDALDQAPKVTLSLKGLLFSPVLVVFGTLMLCPLKPLPPAAETFVVNDKPKTPLRGKIFLTVVALSAVAGGGYYFWLRAFLQDAGYDV
jgi:hypothetical protein